MSVGGEKPHCWIDKALWVLWRSKVPCHRGKERKISTFAPKNYCFLRNQYQLNGGKDAENKSDS